MADKERIREINRNIEELEAERRKLLEEDAREGQEKLEALVGMCVKLNQSYAKIIGVPQCQLPSTLRYWACEKQALYCKV